MEGSSDSGEALRLPDAMKEAYLWAEQKTSEHIETWHDNKFWSEQGGSVTAHRGSTLNRLSWNVAAKVRVCAGSQGTCPPKM